MHFRSLLLSSVSSTVLTVLVEVPFTRRSFDLPCAVSLAKRNGIFDERPLLAAVFGVCSCSCGVDGGLSGETKSKSNSVSVQI